MMTSTYRKLFASSAKSLLDGNSTMNIVGEGARVGAFRSAYDLTHKLYEALFDEDTTLSEIRQIVADKKMAENDFVHQTGVKWIL